MQKPNDSSSARRVLGGERARLSPWHFGSLHASDAVYDVAETNAMAAAYAASPDPETGALLLARFNNLLLKYVALLTTGRASQGPGVGRETRRFLALFKQGGGATAADLAQIAERLPNACLSMDADDVYDELAAIFLDLARRFNPGLAEPGKEFGFTGYIELHFRWAVKARVFQLQRNALNYSSDDVVDVFGAADEAGGDPRDASSAVLGFRLTPAWINVAPPPFDVLLTAQQRRIVVYKFLFDRTDSAIASALRIAGGAAQVRGELAEALAAMRGALVAAAEGDAEDAGFDADALEGIA